MSARIVYAYQLTVEADAESYHYEYSVEPAPFPDHEWVHTAQTTATNASKRQ